MKCLVKVCKNTSLLMTVELCYPCSQLVEQGNDFKPDWNTLQPYIDRIAELEAQLKKHMSIESKNVSISS